MNIRTTFWTLIFALVLFPNLRGQNKEIYIREYYNDKSLELLLFDMELNYNIDFIFNPEEIDGIEIKSKNIKGLNLETALKALLKDTDLDFRIEDGNIIHIYPYVEAEQVYVASTKQNINISGWIYDKDTHETLPYATASIKGMPSGSIANVDGHFILMEVPTDTSTIVFSFLGYETQTMQLHPETAQQKVHIYMQAVDYRIEEVMIIGEEKKLQ